MFWRGERPRLHHRRVARQHVSHDKTDQAHSEQRRHDKREPTQEIVQKAHCQAGRSAELHVEVPFERIPALFNAYKIRSHDPSPVVIPEHSPDTVIDDDLLELLDRCHALRLVGLVHVVVDQFVDLGIRIERSVRALGGAVEVEEQVIERIVDP